MRDKNCNSYKGNNLTETLKRTEIIQNARLIKFLESQKNVLLAYLFGSFTKGEEGKLSDIDIAVLFDKSLNKKERFRLQLELITKINQILQTNKLDLIIINDSPLSLKYEIIKANCPIYIRDEMEKINLEQYVLSRYLDRRYYEKRAAEEFLNQVAERGI